MAYVVTRPCRIGGWREPGEVLSAEDLRGRNVRHMEDHDHCVRFDPSVPEPKADTKPRRGKAAAAGASQD